MGLVKLLTPSRQHETAVAASLSSSKVCHSHHRLITVGYSHYCEKARFALSLSSIHERFQEEQHLPAFHVPFTFDLRNMQRYPQTPQRYHAYDYLNETTKSKTKEKLSSKELTGVPKMSVNISFKDTKNESDNTVNDTKNDDEVDNISKDNNVNCVQASVVIANGSDGIMKYLYHHDDACKHFYPDNIKEEVEKLESYLNTELGVAATDWAFSKMLITSSNPPVRNEKSLDFFLNKLTNNKKNSFLETTLFKIFGKSTFIPLMIDSNGVSEERGKLAKEKIIEVFDKIDVLLSERDNMSAGMSIHYEDDKTVHHNHKSKLTHLFGTLQPTAADITLVTLAAPILLLDATKENFPTLNDMNSYISVQQYGNSNDILKCEGLVEMVEFAEQMKLTKTGK